MFENLLPGEHFAEASAWLVRLISKYSPLLAAVALLAGPVVVAIIMGTA